MDLAQLFLNNTPFLDVRAPVEFSQGAFPHTTNLPLLNDDQRHLVGMCYKQNGKEQAIKLGHEIICGDVKEQLISGWKNYYKNNPRAFLYCARGGMRSQLVHTWLKQSGVDMPLVVGGYKALRSFLISVLESPIKMIRISGRTGVGKTELLQSLSNMVDLESLANHCGSAFGKQLTNQPTQINFENALAINILQNSLDNKVIYIEDESHCIGSVNLPFQFFEQLKQSPIIVLDESIEQRVQRIYQYYVVMQKHKHIAKYGEIDGIEKFHESLLNPLRKINKRLGGVRYHDIQQMMQSALKDDSQRLHKEWITSLLVDYYDPMYDFQIAKKSDKVLFMGNKKQVLDFANKNC